MSNRTELDDVLTSLAHELGEWPWPEHAMFTTPVPDEPWEHQVLCECGKVFTFNDLDLGDLEDIEEALGEHLLGQDLEDHL